MASKPKIITFVKNPILGTVKTRLAKAIGDSAALSVYKALLEKTRSALMDSRLREMIEPPIVYYNNHIPKSDEWSTKDFKKGLQVQGDLGQKLEQAIKEQFASENQGVIVIGSDCPTLTGSLLIDAVEALGHHDLVIGPAKDGGYYLLGMSKFFPQFFQKMPWSTNIIFQKTLEKAQNMSLSVHELPVLNDVDELSDLMQYPDLQRFVS